MARQYIIQSWNNAAEYSGEMIGNRLGSSQHIIKKGGRWQANLQAYADEDPKKPVKKKKSVVGSIDLAERNYSRLEGLSKQLDEEYRAGEIEADYYDHLRDIMDKKLDKGWKRVAREKGPLWEEQERSEKLKAEADLIAFLVKERAEKIQRRKAIRKKVIKIVCKPFTFVLGLMCKKVNQIGMKYRPYRFMLDLCTVIAYEFSSHMLSCPPKQNQRYTHHG